MLELVDLELIWITFRQLGGSVYSNAPYFIWAHMFCMEMLIRKIYFKLKSSFLSEIFLKMY